MKVNFLTYCSKEYLKSANKLIKSAQKYNRFNETLLYTREDLVKTDFYQENKKILDEPEGGGCFLWKIYYLHKEYFNLEEGDILFYVDAGSNFVSDPYPLIELCNKKNIVLFNLNNKPLNKEWTKRDTFVYMNCDTVKYHDSEQYNAAFQIYKKCESNDKFIEELLQWGRNFDIISYRPNNSGKNNLEGFVDHRSDQSILSILACKYNIGNHRDPSQHGNHMKMFEYRQQNEWQTKDYLETPMMNSPYPTIINHHRNTSSYSHIKEKISFGFFIDSLRHKLKVLLNGPQ